MGKIVTIDYFQSPFGELMLGSFDDRLRLCDWRYRKMRPAIDKRIREGLDASYEQGDNPVNREMKDQLTEYFNGERTEFNIPVNMVGSPFQRSVWEELLKIPFGFFHPLS